MKHSNFCPPPDMDLVATLLREDLARDFSCNIVVVYLYLK